MPAAFANVACKDTGVFITMKRGSETKSQLCCVISGVCLSVHQANRSLMASMFRATLGIRVSVHKVLKMCLAHFKHQAGVCRYYF